VPPAGGGFAWQDRGVTTLLVVVAIAIVGAVVVLVVRDRPLIEDDPVGSRALRWSGAQDMTSHDLAEVRFTVALRGYRMEQVDLVLDDTRAALSERDARIVELQRVVAALGRDRARVPAGEPPRGFGEVDTAQDVGDSDHADMDPADVDGSDVDRADMDHSEGEDRS
jgi:DivIVA domain-containing protein